MDIESKVKSVKPTREYALLIIIPGFLYEGSKKKAFAQIIQEGSGRHLKHRLIVFPTERERKKAIDMINFTRNNVPGKYESYLYKLNEDEHFHISHTYQSLPQVEVSEYTQRNCGGIQEDWRGSSNQLVTDY